MYLENEDFGDVLYYSGSGDDRAQNTLEHRADQKLDNQGNLALHNSYEYGIEVRVIRGVNCKLHNRGHNKDYIYDGLYRVVSSTFGRDKSGYNVCKFRLLCLPGQAELGSKGWQIAQQLKDTMDDNRGQHLSLRRGYISLDLSKGTETFSIPVCNTVDDDRSPMLFEYIVRPEFPVPVKWPWRTPGCDSKCSCHCQAKDSGEPPAAYSKEGILEMGRPVVYECGALCGCPITCTNRVTQRGMKHRLEVFRFGPSGETAAVARWGVRTLDLILPGSFVCEYGGEVVVMDHQPHNGGDAPWEETKENRIFIDPAKLPQRWREWGDTDGIELAIKRHHFPEFAGPSYILDVSQKRNVACYIGHSYTPNVFLQYVVRGNEDESFPHLMVFAMETIPPMRELTIDWGNN
jgi:euchromatic histone-lysine N-methyltransferase